MKKIAVFASGRGSNFKAIFDQIKSGNINGKIVCLISNNPNSQALRFAKKNKIDTFIIDTKSTVSTKKTLSILKFFSVELIVLAGYFVTRGKEELDFDWEEDDDF